MVIWEKWENIYSHYSKNDILLEIKNSVFVELGIRANSSALFGQTAAEISHLGPNNSPTTVVVDWALLAGLSNNQNLSYTKSSRDMVSLNDSSLEPLVCPVVCPPLFLFKQSSRTCAVVERAQATCDYIMPWGKNSWWSLSLLLSRKARSLGQSCHGLKRKWMILLEYCIVWTRKGSYLLVL